MHCPAKQKIQLVVIKVYVLYINKGFVSLYGNDWEKVNCKVSEQKTI